MTRSMRKVARAAVACMIAGVMSFGALISTAGAQQAATFNAKSSAFALKVTIDLSGLPAPVKAQIDAAYVAARALVPPTELASVPETFPYVIDQTFLSTSSDASNAVTKALSKLGLGTFDLPSLEAGNVGEDKTSQSQNVQLPPVNDLLDVSAVNAGIGNLRAAVGAGPVVNADSSMANVTSSLANLNEFLPAEVAAVLQTVMDAVNDTIADANSTLNTTLTSVTNDVNSLLQGTQTPETPLDGLLDQAGVSDALDQIADQVGDTIPNVELPEIPNMLQVTSLATVDALKSQALSQRTGDGRTVSDSSAQLASIDVLSGFFNTGLIDVRSHSESSGVAGSANNSSYCTVADARIGDVAGVALDGSKIYVDVNGEPVAVPVVNDLIPQVKSQLDSVLAAAGIAVELCDAADGSKAADGTSAKQSVSAFKITLEPKVTQVTDLLGTQLPAGSALGVKVVIDPTVTTEANTTNAVAAVSLPRTGATSLVTMGFGMALMGTAYVLRRRMVRVRVK